MIAHTTTPSTTRPFTTTEQELRQRAQQQLIQKRLNAHTLEEQGQKAFRRALRSTEQPPLLPTPALPARPAPSLPASREQIIPASLEAAMDRIRHPRPGTPAAWAVDAVERARPIVEAHVKRRDARHNALMVYRALAQAAYALIQVRAQQHAHTTTYTFFTVLDLLPVVTGLSSDQCERATRRLQDLGLIHKTSGALPTQTGGKRQYRGGTWVPTTFLNAEGQKVTTQACAGTWVAVLLRPAPGITARVISHELPPCPRDLTTDRKKGRTAWQRLQEAKSEVRESFLLTGDEFNITPLLQWSLPENNQKSLGTVDSRTSVFKDAKTPQELLWSLSRVASTHPRHRREAVQEGAARLVQLLDDEGWEQHYYRVLWRATEAEFRGCPAYAQLAAALQRTLISKAELGLSRPGAWLTHQLRECGWMDNVYHVKSA
ncbi:hypothetical protein [Deinococcus sp. RIT780]|uniref:hypothetical protein n=1 Tax=Deinococcus sp. RIT780 TaxID=2870472 RepID=UPI001C8AC80D|nr:hypothetical protein [Deinococcus sp. RIT780]MBX8463675.1 hypothetical protein [Deinococcus sp. RIT780]